MPIGLLDGAARRADRLMRLAGTIGSLLAGARLRVVTHLSGMEVGMDGVAYVLEDECLAAIAYDHPFSGSDIELLHRLLPRMRPAPIVSRGRQPRQHGTLAQCNPPRARQ